MIAHDIKSSDSIASPPAALLFIAAGCPHCPVVLHELSQLVKEGRLGSLEVVNVAAHPERARRMGIRSVPWTRIGPFSFEQALSPKELRQWTELANTPEGRTRYLEHLLSSHRLVEVEHLAHGSPEYRHALIQMLGKPSTSMQARIGIDSVISDLAGSQALADLVHELGQLSRREESQIRADACHYLALTSSEEARPYLLNCLNDPHPDVVEIAQESLTTLDGKDL